MRKSATQYTITEMTYDDFMLALCIWREGRGQSKAALSGIAAVVRNRANQPGRWPNTIPGVILQHAQFSSFNSTDPNSAKFPIPPSGAHFSPFGDWQAWLDCLEVVSGSPSDPTAGATNYESIEDPAKRPEWAEPSRMTAQIGAFRFYRL
jgi:spore germination cell wall hydrolase CwlJ-like protein